MFLNLSIPYTKYEQNIEERRGSKKNSERIGVQLS